MAITTRDGLLAAMAGASQLARISKSAPTVQVANGYASYWRSTGVPVQGAIPTTAAICDAALAGSIPYSYPVGGNTLYVARAALAASVVGGAELHDRLGHMAGLSGTLTTAQAVGLDLTGAASNLAARRGNADFGDVRWWLEWYAATGTTARTATVGVTLAGGGSASIAVAIPASTGAARMIPIIDTLARPIQSVDAVTLNGTTGTAGNFGVTATRAILSLGLLAVNTPLVFDWVGTGLAQITDQSCLMLLGVQSAATGGAIFGDYTWVSG